MSLIMDAIKRAQQLRLRELTGTPSLRGPNSLRGKKRFGRKPFWFFVIGGSGVLFLLLLWEPYRSPLSTSHQKQTALSIEKQEDTATPTPPNKSLESPKEEIQLPEVEKTPPLASPLIEKKIDETPTKRKARKKIAKGNPLPEPEGEIRRMLPVPVLELPAQKPVAPPPKEDALPRSMAIEPDREKKRIFAFEVSTHFNLGVQFYHQRDILKAIQSYRKVIELDPTYIEAYNNLGIIYQEMGDLDNALWAYQKAIDINPRYEKALNNLGILLYLKGRDEESMEAFQRALAVNSTNIEAHINLGILFKKRGQIDKANEYYLKVLSLNPLHGEAHYNMALLCEQLANTDAAIDHYQKFIHLSSKSHPDLVTKVQRHLNYLIGVKDKGR